jgi:hypothetical protein
MRGLRLVVLILLPLGFVVAAVVALWLSGYAARDFADNAFLGASFYGFFFDNYALFLLAAVYALGSLVATVLAGGVRSRPFAMIALVPLLALVLLAAFYPTFGGLVVRTGYVAATALGIFNIPAPLGVIAGALSAAFLLALVLGLSRAVLRLKARFSLGGLGAAVFGWLALAVAPLIYVLAPQVAGGFPAVPVSTEALPVLLVASLAAFAPHALVAALAQVRV